jgi:hypothetical protein
MQANHQIQEHALGNQCAVGAHAELQSVEPALQMQGAAFKTRPRATRVYQLQGQGTRDAVQGQATMQMARVAQFVDAQRGGNETDVGMAVGCEESMAEKTLAVMRGVYLHAVDTDACANVQAMIARIDAHTTLHVAELSGQGLEPDQADAEGGGGMLGLELEVGRWLRAGEQRPGQQGEAECKHVKPPEA